MTWNCSIYMQELETLSALCVIRNRRKAHSNTSNTATRRGTIDSRDTMASRSCDCIYVRNMPIDNRDVSLLSMACLALGTNCTRIRECLLAGRPRRQGLCRRVGAKLMSRASSMQLRGTATSTQEPYFPGDSQYSVRSTYVIVEKPTATPAVQQLDVEP